MIFTWLGATIQLDGFQLDSITEERRMIAYRNVHHQLEEQRRIINDGLASGSSEGPRVLILGTRNSGKSSLTKTLINWAIQVGRKPRYVDLDTSGGSISLPCCVAATSVEEIHAGTPLVYFYGNRFPSENIRFYKEILREFARTLNNDFPLCVESQAAGMVVNSMPADNELILFVIELFSIDNVVVLDQDKNLNVLEEILRLRTNVRVINLPRLRGIPERTTLEHQIEREESIKDYFSPQTSFMVFFENVRIYRINRPPYIALLQLVDINPELLHSVLALLSAMGPDQLSTSEWMIVLAQTPIGQILSIQPNQISFLILGQLTWDLGEGDRSTRLQGSLPQILQRRKGAPIRPQIQLIPLPEAS